MAGIKVKSLDEFLNKSVNVYQVPIYQRKYTWDENDCEKFLLDIYNWYKKLDNAEINIDQDSYFAGNIITFTDEKNISSIVDGQQRITTTILILCALKSVLAKDNKDTRDVDKLIFYKSRELDSREQKKLKLNNPKNDYILLKLSNLEFNYNSDDILTRNFLHLVNIIENIKKTNENFSDDILESLKFTILSHVILNKKDNPTEIFETINTTGKKLTPADMIKNYIFFYSYKYIEKENELSKIYDEIENLLYVSDKKVRNTKTKSNKKDDQDIDMMTFFRYFNSIISGKELVKKESLDIFKQFKEIYNDVDFSILENVLDILKVLKKHAWIWNKIHKHEPKKPIDRFFYNCFKDAIYTYYTLVHQLIEEKMEIDEFGNYKINENYLSEIFRIIAKLIFSLLISGKPEKEITRDIPNIYKNFKKSGFINFEEWMISRSKNNEGIVILDKEGIERHINNTNVYTMSSKRTKYLLYGIEGMLDNWEIEIKKFDDFTIEHISPQNPFKDSDYYNYALKISKNEVEAEDYLERIKHKLPNLTLIVGETNSELSNKAYKDKFKIFNDRSFLSINKAINEYKEWTQETLKLRAEWFVEKIDELFRK